jgi:DNA invertase Pin-like site-specific DNA recombinase
MSDRIAYSYIRFSSQKQLQGDSLRRQLSMARRYADANGLKLDERLTLKDLGVSAYDKSNIERGALSSFLTLVRQGKIERGSYLLVEQFDRLSRADVFTAFSLFSDLVNAGIILVTLADEKVYDSHTKLDLGSLMMSIAMMFRSHEESLSKSRRVRAAWKEKRDSAAPFMTSECPRWLQPNSDKTGYVVIPDKAASVRRVFDLMAAGYGNVSIVRRANLEGWPVPGKATVWHATLVTKLSRNRSVLGEYQPMTKLDGKRVPVGEPRPNFYPQVVDEGLFLRAQASKATRAQLPRRRDKDYMNIFQGILKCGHCGSSFLRKNKGSKAQPGYVQYLCAKRIIAAEGCKSMSGLRLEPALLRHIFDRSLEAVSSDFLTDHLRDEIAAGEEQLKSEKAKKANLLSVMVEAPSAGDLMATFLQIEERIQQLKGALEQNREWLAINNSSIDESAMLTDYADALKKIKAPEEIEFRASLHDRIVKIVEAAYVYGDKLAVLVKWRSEQEPTAFRVTDDGSVETIPYGTLVIPK